MELRTITDPADWHALAEAGHAPLPQRWLYGEVAARLGRCVARLAVYDVHRAKTDPAEQPHKPAAFAQFVSRTVMGIDVALASRGPVFLNEPCKQSALQTLRRGRPKVAITLITPQERLHRLSLSPRGTSCDWDLSLPLDTLRAQQQGKWRNGLKKAEKSNLKVRELRADAAALMPLLRTEKKRQDSGLYRALPPEFVLALLEVDPHALRLFAAGDAQMLFVQHGNSATYHIGHTGDAGRAQNAHRLILWDAVKRLKADGVERLDLGTIDQKRAPDLARFKLRTGATPCPIGPAQLL